MSKHFIGGVLAAVASCTAAGVLLASSAVASPHHAGRPGAVHTAAARPVHLTLPAPTGPDPVGTFELHLIDRSRRNPWAASPPYRELMVSIWYPARDTARYPRSPQMLAGAAAHYGSKDGFGSLGYNVPPGKVDWAATLTSGHVGAPLAAHAGSLPVVLFSPGAREPRTSETIAVQDLASRGYIVVTIDHTYESSEVEFPGGRVIDGSAFPTDPQQLQKLLKHGFPRLAKKIVTVRVADVRFVINELAALDAGHNPDAGHRPLPAGLAGALDMNHIGMFGVSAGGFTALQAMHEDRRIKAGIDVDGAVESPFIPKPISLAPVFASGLNRPFLLMGDPQTNHNTVPSWKSIWDHSSGWHADLTLKGASGENAYKDAVWQIPQIARRLSLPADYVTQQIGTVDPAAAVRGEEAYLAAFFGRFLRGQDNHLLDGPSPQHPEFEFVR